MINKSTFKSVHLSLNKIRERSYCKSILLYVQDILGFQDIFNLIVGEFGSSLQNDWQNFGWDEIAKLECLLYATKACISEGI